MAKLFPDKNRTNDSIPYDHARVMLPTTTDDYINACHVRVSNDFSVSVYLYAFFYFYFGTIEECLRWERKLWLG